MASMHASVIRCSYVYSSEYRKLVNLMAKVGYSLSSGLWWVERVDGSAGKAYHLFNGRVYFGKVMEQDIGNDDVNTALWNLMSFVERHCDVESSLFVFPYNWEGTDWAIKSHEFLAITGKGCRLAWVHYVKGE